MVRRKLLFSLIFVILSLFVFLLANQYIFTSEPTFVVGYSFLGHPISAKGIGTASKVFNDQSMINATNVSTKVILLWTPFFGVSQYIIPLNRTTCTVTSCIFTSDRKLYPTADALIFHIRDVELNDLPDESLRKHHQLWIMLLHESPEFTPKDVIKALNGKINLTMTHRFDSDISLTPVSSVLAPGDEPLLNDVNEIEAIIQNKSRMVAWFVSHCSTPSNRELYVRELQKYVTVDIFGKCGPYRCFPKMSSKCYNETATHYHFYLSFENSLCKDYVTEKLFNVLEFPIIPIAMTSADLSVVAPPNSVISVGDFNDPHDLATYLIHLVKSPKEYMSYFQWKKQYRVKGLEHYSCRLCKLLQSEFHQTISKVYEDLSQWWFTQANCKTNPFKN